MNKFIMNQTPQGKHIKYTLQNFDYARQPIRIALQKKSVNPESLVCSFPRSETDRTKPSMAMEDIRSPFQKESFLRRSVLTRTCPNEVELQSESADNLMSRSRPQNRSFSSLKVRQNFMYLQHVVSGLANHTDFASISKFVSHLDGQLAVNCQKIKKRLERGLTAVEESNFVLNRVRKTYLACCQEDSSPNDLQKMLDNLQQKFTHLRKEVQDHRSRGQPKQKILQLKQLSKVLNERLQVESQQLRRQAEEEKSKLKNSYQEIYCKIYEENSKLKRENGHLLQLIQSQRAEHLLFKTSHESFCTAISDQLSELKVRFGQLKKNNDHEKNQNDLLSSQIKMKEQLNRKLQDTVTQCSVQLFQHCKRIEYLSHQLSRSTQNSDSLQKQVQTLQAEVDNLRSVNATIFQKLQEGGRKNSTASLLFQLSQKSYQTQRGPADDRQQPEQQLLSSEGKIQSSNQRLHTVLECVSAAENILNEKQLQLQKAEQEMCRVRVQYQKESLKKQLLKDEMNDLFDKCQKLAQSQTELEAANFALASTYALTKQELLQTQRQMQETTCSFDDLKDRSENLKVAIEELERRQSQCCLNVRHLIERKEEIEGEINSLLFNLIRLQSDTLMLKLNSGSKQATWVEEWLKWIKNANRTEFNPQ